MLRLWERVRGKDMGKLKDMERMEDLAPKQATHTHETSVVGPYYAQFINAHTVVCYKCVSGELAACANCKDTLAGYLYGTVFCKLCASV